eukprot:gnl/TRDRNA2_/TRDRNA2_80915_c0_seq1.p1 gnl/TRDRNA2_/TRDRNA2_80915_c0~~gnl/TRDRNA2_/TRDRNA2_80915_c0_seq1.p1  ORF type:complete len:817 (+),score=141.93 gnl/TRDRNA2_/TRDRNA2_80915_c0_seq1:143-2452(+)
MSDPVSTVDGCVYDREYIVQWFRHKRQLRQVITSPATGLELPSSTLMPLVALQKAIEAYLMHRPEIKRDHFAGRSFEEAASMLQGELLEKQTMHATIHDEVSSLRAKVRELQYENEELKRTRKQAMHASIQDEMSSLRAKVNELECENEDLNRRLRARRIRKMSSDSGRSFTETGLHQEEKETEGQQSNCRATAKVAACWQAAFPSEASSTLCEGVVAAILSLGGGFVGDSAAGKATCASSSSSSGNGAGLQLQSMEAAHGGQHLEDEHLSSGTSSTECEDGCAEESGEDEEDGDEEGAVSQVTSASGRQDIARRSGPCGISVAVKRMSLGTRDLNMIGLLRIYRPMFRLLVIFVVALMVVDYASSHSVARAFSPFAANIFAICCVVMPRRAEGWQRGTLSTAAKLTLCVSTVSLMLLGAFSVEAFMAWSVVNPLSLCMVSTLSVDLPISTVLREQQKVENLEVLVLIFFSNSLNMMAQALRGSRWHPIFFVALTTQLFCVVLHWGIKVHEQMWHTAALSSQWAVRCIFALGIVDWMTPPSMRSPLLLHAGLLLVARQALLFACTGATGNASRKKSPFLEATQMIIRVVFNSLLLVVVSYVEHHGRTSIVAGILLLTVRTVLVTIENIMDAPLVLDGDDKLLSGLAVAIYFVGWGQIFRLVCVPLVQDHVTTFLISSLLWTADKKWSNSSIILDISRSEPNECNHGTYCASLFNQSRYVSCCMRIHAVLLVCWGILNALIPVMLNYHMEVFIAGHAVWCALASGALKFL